jgi:1-aminocyclopropane-1-carboxylate deaminase/D-cysteine desulfhydrase-like pyridoxal-dependent ACC family enzyme
MSEIVDQAKAKGVSLDAVVVASSAGATQAGFNPRLKDAGRGD